MIKLEVLQDDLTDRERSSVTTKIQNGCPECEGRDVNCNQPSAVPTSALPAIHDCSLPRQIEMATQFDGTSMPESWLADLRGRAAQPLNTSNQYERAVAACVAEHEAQQKRKPSNFTLSSSVLEAQQWAWLFALLVALLIVLWLGGELAEATLSLSAGVADH